jgi:hypothetical protein
MQESIPRKRTACDRCHGHKLRCPRPLLGSTCSRCQKAGVQCVFGLSKRGNTARILPQQSDISNIAPDGSSTVNTMLFEPVGSSLTDHMEFDLNFPNETLYGLPLNDVDLLLETYPDQNTVSMSYPSLTTPPSLANFDPSAISRAASNSSDMQTEFLGNIAPLATVNASENASSLPNLSNNEKHEDQSIDLRLLILSQKLIRLKSCIPPTSMHKAGLPFTLPPGLQNETPVPSSNFNQDEQTNGSKDILSISDSLQLTQVLLQVYSDFTATIKCHLAQDQTILDQYSECVDTSIGPSKHREGPMTRRGSHTTSSVDEATILLLLSCHNRIIQIWDLLFEHTREMVKYRVFDSLDWRSRKSCSQLQIGSFTPSSNAALVMVVTTILSELVVDLDKSLQQLYECLQAELEKHESSHKIDEQDPDSVVESGPNVSNISPLAALIPACDTTIALSKQLIQTFERCRASLGDSGLLN